MILISILTIESMKLLCVKKNKYLVWNDVEQDLILSNIRLDDVKQALILTLSLPNKV